MNNFWNFFSKKSKILNFSGPLDKNSSIGVLKGSRRTLRAKFQETDRDFLVLRNLSKKIQNFKEKFSVELSIPHPTCPKDYFGWKNVRNFSTELKKLDFDRKILARFSEPHSFCPWEGLGIFSSEKDVLIFFWFWGKKVPDFKRNFFGTFVKTAFSQSRWMFP